jgi:hypothetical protein
MVSVDNNKHTRNRQHQQKSLDAQIEQVIAPPHEGKNDVQRN